MPSIRRILSLVAATLFFLLVMVPMLAQQPTVSNAVDISALQKEISELRKIIHEIGFNLRDTILLIGTYIILLAISLLFLPDRRKLAAVFFPIGILVTAAGAGTPWFINWIFESAVDAKLFE